MLDSARRRSRSASAAPRLNNRSISPIQRIQRCDRIPLLEVALDDGCTAQRLATHVILAGKGCKSRLEHRSPARTVRSRLRHTFPVEQPRVQTQHVLGHPIEPVQQCPPASAGQQRRGLGIRQIREATPSPRPVAAVRQPRQSRHGQEGSGRPPQGSLATRARPRPGARVTGGMCETVRWVAVDRLTALVALCEVMASIQQVQDAVGVGVAGQRARHLCGKLGEARCPHEQRAVSRRCARESFVGEI